VLTILNLKTGLVTKQVHEDRTWAEASVRPKQWKWNMSFGTCRVRSLYRSGSLTAGAKELARYKLNFGAV